jgi:hypothetical protein
VRVSARPLGSMLFFGQDDPECALYIVGMQDGMLLDSSSGGLIKQCCLSQVDHSKANLNMNVQSAI